MPILKASYTIAITPINIHRPSGTPEWDHAFAPALQLGPFIACVDGFDADLRLEIMDSAISTVSGVAHRFVDTVVVDVSRFESVLPEVQVSGDGSRDYSLRAAFFSGILDVYAHAAVGTVNRLLRYFRYQLKTPGIREISAMDLSSPEWSTGEGTVLDCGIIVLDMEVRIPQGPGLDVSSSADIERALACDISVGVVEEYLATARDGIGAANWRRAIIDMYTALEIQLAQAYLQGQGAAAVLGTAHRLQMFRLDLEKALTRLAGELFGRNLREEKPEVVARLLELRAARNLAVHRGVPHLDAPGDAIEMGQGMVQSWLEATEDAVAWLRTLEET